MGKVDLFKNRINLKEVNFNLILNSFKSFIDKHFIIYFKEYPLLVDFLLTALFNTWLLRALTVNNFLDWKPLVADAAMLLILSSFMFLFSKDKRGKQYLLILSCLTSIICIIHSIYYTYYSSFASISLLATSTNVVDVGDAVFEQVLKPLDFLYLWQPIFVYYCYKKDKKGIKKNLHSRKKIESKKVFLKKRKRAFADLCIVSVCILSFASLFVTKTEWSRFGKMWNRESVVSIFGIYTYQVNDIFQSLEPKINNLFGHDKAYKTVVDYYSQVDNENSTNEYSGIFEGMNVIVIHAESLQTIALNNEFNGVEVTPTLNRLASEGIYFSNYYSQVGVGTSSDAEFTFSTSLMPSSNGTVFVNYFDRQYLTIQQFFKDKGYYTFSMHGNTGDFWNRATMHKNMGYDKFYSKSSFDIDETIGLGISDKSFFRQAVPMIKDIIDKEQKPFYGTMITLTNHTPWSDLDLIDEFDTTWTVSVDGEDVVRDYLQDNTLGIYFRNVHYMDQAIEQFINDLDEAGILDNTVIVIYGDHDARISRKNYNIMYNYNPYTDTLKVDGDDGYVDYNEYQYRLDKKVPFIIWTKNKMVTKRVETATGMIDAFPILGNLFNLKNNEFQLGHDILGNGDVDNTVAFTDGSYVTNKIYYNGQNSEIYSVNGGAVDEDYIKMNALYADDLIEVSNNIITYDLIKEITTKNEKKENLP